MTHELEQRICERFDAFQRPYPADLDEYVAKWTQAGWKVDTCLKHVEAALRQGIVPSLRRVNKALERRHGKKGKPTHPTLVVNNSAQKTNGQINAMDLNERLRTEGPEAVRKYIEENSVPFEQVEEPKKEEPEKNGGRSQHEKSADVLIRLARAGATLFHTQDGTAFADIKVGNHCQTWAVDSRAFKGWLAHKFFVETSGAPGSEVMQSALNVITAIARYKGEQHEVYLRVAEVGGNIYLDLADDEWRVVEITKEGWKVVTTQPVRFRRTPGMLPLPEPRRDGKIEDLRAFLNLPDDNAFILIVSVLLNGLRAGYPHPVLALSGEHGSAKSTVSAVVRRLLDPNRAPLRSLPSDDRDLFVTATNTYYQCFDNLSGIPRSVSDTLCRLSTGGGFGTRQLYTDQDEVLFSGTRPIILNGIEDIITRPDLADRCVFITLPEIQEDARKPEKMFWAEFEEKRPGILGALLDGAVRGLRRLPSTKIDRLPRMADFATWATACESVSGSFLKAYIADLDDAAQLLLESEPVALALIHYMEGRQGWKGTASVLLETLTLSVDVKTTVRKSWPKEAHHLSGRLRRAAPHLRKVGIEVEFTREGHDRTRQISLAKVPVPKKEPKSASAASAGPEGGKNTNISNKLGADADSVKPPSAVRPQVQERPRSDSAADTGNTAGAGADASSVRSKLLKNNDKNDADAADAKFGSSLGQDDEDMSWEG